MKNFLVISKALLASCLAGIFIKACNPWCTSFIWLMGKVILYKRNSFNIHGGDHKGSIGCIDIGDNDKDFFDELRKDFAKQGEAILMVDYSGKSSKSCDCIKISPARWR